jgi:hypothetical protein
VVSGGFGLRGERDLRGLARIKYYGLRILLASGSIGFSRIVGWIPPILNGLRYSIHWR